MARKLEREDDKFFYYDDGSKSSKQGLTQPKLDAMSAEIQKNQMAASAANLTASDPRFDAQQSFESISDQSKLSRTEPQMSQTAPQSVLGVPVNQPTLGVPMGQAPMALPVGAGTMDLTQYNRPMPKTVRTTETQVGTPLPKAELEAAVKGFDAQISAQRKLAETAAAGQIEQAKIQEGLTQELDKINQQRLEIEQAKQTAINDFDAKYNDTMSQLQNAKIDPDRFYGGSVGKRVLAGISIALGQFGASMTGGRNAALDIINKAIDDDISAQKEGIQKLGSQATLQRQFMADIRQKFADKDQAQLVQKAAAIEMAQNKITEIASRTSSEQAKVNAENLIGQLQVQKLDLLSKGQQLAAGKTVIRTQTEQGGGGVNPAEQVKAASPLRKEYNDSPVTKMTIGRRESFNTMSAAAEQDSPSGDISFIYAYMKMNDPTSTVREGEFATAQNAGSIPESIRNLYNKAISGQRLTKEQKASFLSTGRSIFDRQLKEQEKENERFEKLALRSGFDPQDVIINFQPYDPNQISQTFRPKAQPVKSDTNQVMRGR
jgi:hypothetical protein